MNAPRLSHPVDLARVTAGGTVVRFAASAAEREGIAGEYGFLDVKSLAAEATLTLQRAGAVLVEGRVTADIVQACVVTLEPVPQSLEEPFKRLFLRDASAELPAKAGAEIKVDIDADDPPEPLAGPSLDLGPIVLEHFLLGVDPYPRALGAELPAELTGAPDDADSPFAALAALRGETPEKSG